MNKGLRGLKRSFALLCYAAVIVASVAGCSNDQGDANKGGDVPETNGAKSDIIKSIQDLNLPSIGDDYTVNLGYYN